MEQDVVGAGHVRPQAAGDLAELLVDDHLLEHGPALAADVLRQRAGVEVGLDRDAPELVADRLGQHAVVTLELLLVRLQHLLGVASGTLAQLDQLGGEGEVHVSMVARGMDRRAARRGRWDADLPVRPREARPRGPEARPRPRYRHYRCLAGS